MFHRAFAVALLLWVLTGCTQQAATPSIFSDANTNEAQQQTQSFAVPTPASAQVGTVTGQLLLIKDGTNVPFEGIPLYLGSVITSDQGVEGMVKLAKSTAPKVLTDAQGNFAFTDVSPGKYGLMLDTPRGAVLLNQPPAGTNMVVEVQGGDTISLGELPYDIELDVSSQ